MASQETTIRKDVDYYMSLPYPIELIRDPEGWFVAVRDLPGCMSQGDTIEEAIDMSRDAQRGWIEIALENGQTVPLPRSLATYSGKFNVRVPRAVHRDLVEEAEAEGVSLNHLVSTTLANTAMEKQWRAALVEVRAELHEELRRQLAPIVDMLSHLARSEDVRDGAVRPYGIVDKRW